MKTILSIFFVALALSALASNFEEAKLLLKASPASRNLSQRKTGRDQARREKSVKPSAKKTSGDLAKKATEPRAKFLQRFDANRDDKVTKEETKAVLAAEAKKRAAAREKKKR